jgi:hypothetical protein
MATTSPTSFRLRPETLAQLDRVAALLTAKHLRRDEQLPDEPELAFLDARSVSRAEALSVAVAETLKRLESELGVAPERPSPFRSAADANRGLLANLGAGSLVDELTAERRAEAAADEVDSAGRAARRR